MLTAMQDAPTLVREARENAGLSLRGLAERADVAYTTICRIEHGQVDPTWGTLCKLFDALGEELGLERRQARLRPQLADLADAWTTDRAGQEQPDWTRLRALLDALARNPDLAAHAIRAKPRPSGSAFFDNLLAGIAEKVADDASMPRPAWTKKVSTLDEPWESLGTPRMRADAAARTPSQLAARRILVPARTLWRNTTS
jgi:transcriptional regulator with XRE-family HTH domain